MDRGIRWSIAGFIILFMAQSASAQLMGQCTLHSVLDFSGDCAYCPGDESYCTELIIVYDAWCSGLCLMGYVCEVTETEYVTVYSVYQCDSHCNDPQGPFCQQGPLVDSLRAWVPKSCGCLAN